MKTKAFIATRTLILIIALMILQPIGQSLAADITVDADCSLANAIRSANGEDMVEPMMDCEAGDGADDNAEGETLPGLDTITIDIAGTHEGMIALDATLAVSSNIVIEGAGFSVNGGGNQIFSVSLSSLSLNDLTMSNGFSVENGGAISVTEGSLTLSNSAVRDSGARGFGGGIYALDSAVTLLDSVISGNATGAAAEDYPPVEVEEHEDPDDDGQGDAGSGDGDAQGADHDHESGNANTLEPTATPEATATPEVSETEEEELPEVAGTYGGGLYFAGADSSLAVDRSGVDSNSSPEAGGGIYIASGSAEISNSTISGNSATVDGGGIYNVGNSVFKHLTVVGNTALTGGGIVDAATLQLYNSILSDNAGGDCSGSLNANLGNIIHDGSCNHDGVTADPNLLQLAGSPAYYIPQEGSPALDAALADYCTEFDQRGIERLAESCDIGAAEFESGAFNFQIQSALAALTPGGGGGSSSSSNAADERVQEEVRLEPTLTASDCGDLPGHIIVTGATPSLNCTMLDWAGVGNQMLVNNGALYAVDLYGWVATPVTVCFQHDSGGIVLLDAANSPRNIVPLRTYPDGNRQCATVDRVGSAVYMPLGFFTAGAIMEPIWDISGCTVITTDILNLRAGASSDTSVLANVLNDVSLAADMRATNYYRVNYYGIIGWLSKDYLTLSGSCY